MFTSRPFRILQTLKSERLAMTNIVLFCSSSCFGVFAGFLASALSARPKSHAAPHPAHVVEGLAKITINLQFNRNNYLWISSTSED